MKYQVTQKVMAMASLLAIMACNDIEPKDYVVFSGSVENVSDPEIRFWLNNYKKKKTLDKDGSFSDTLDIKAGVYSVLFGSKQIQVYLAKGSHVQMSLDEKKGTEALAFSGDHADFNTYLNDKQVTIQSLKLYGGYKGDGFKGSDKEFMQVLDSTQAVLNDRLKKVEGLTDAMYLNEEQAINSWKVTHQMHFKHDKGKKGEPIAPEISKMIDKNIQKMFPLDEEAYSFSSDYFVFITFYLDKKAREIMAGDPLADYYDVKIGLILDIDNETIRNSELYNMVKGSMPHSKNLDKEYREFMQHCTNQEYREKITAIYEDMLKLKPGNPSPGFENYVNYDGGHSSLADFRGKYVYIDIWATWCKPCKYEFPFLEEIRAKYSGRNIEFVGVSVDRLKDKAKWEAMVKGKQLGGVQLLADNAVESNFIQAYKIRGIPRFILLDTEGNIVSSDAPRPSSEKLMELFAGLDI